MIVGEVCTCGATYDKFRAVGDDGHELTYASARDALRVGSHDPELWRSKGRGAVLRLWGELKRAQWEVTHGYCASIAAERAEHGDTSFDVEAFDNAIVEPVKDERCDCDHCNPERWMRAAGLLKDTTRKGPRTMKSKSTISLRRTLAAYTVRKSGDSGGDARPLCAVADCPSEGRGHICPADGTQHGHGCVHYDDCHSDLTFNRTGGWKWVCDEHWVVLVDARKEWEARGVIAHLGCFCPKCASERARRRQSICAGVENAMGPCSIEQCARGVACTVCQGVFKKSAQKQEARRG